MFIGEYERRKKVEVQQDNDTTGLAMVVVALQDQMMENDDKRKWKNGKWRMMGEDE